jgi:hypothetical protein
MKKIVQRDMTLLNYIVEGEESAVEQASAELEEALSFKDSTVPYAGFVDIPVRIGEIAKKYSVTINTTV